MSKNYEDWGFECPDSEDKYGFNEPLGWDDEHSSPDPERALAEQREQRSSDNLTSFIAAIEELFKQKTATAATSGPWRLPAVLRAETGLNTRTPTARAYNYSPLTAPLRKFIKLIREYSTKQQLVGDEDGVPSVFKIMYRTFDEDDDMNEGDSEHEETEAEAAQRITARRAREPFMIIAGEHDDDPTKFVAHYGSGAKERQLATWAIRKMWENRRADGAARERARRKAQKARRKAKRAQVTAKGCA